MLKIRKKRTVKNMVTALKIIKNTDMLKKMKNGRNEIEANLKTRI
jgi:hypothetical protein